MEIDNIKKMFQTCKGIDLQLQKDADKYATQSKELTEQLKYLEQAQAFLQKVAQETQEHLKFQIEDIVDVALDTCFPGEYKFKINFNISRGKTDAELLIVNQKTGKEIEPMEASGGGVTDILALALRLACWTLENGNDNTMVLDEPMKWLSKDILPLAGEMLKSLSEKLNLQIIFVTHEKEFINVADRIFEVKKDKDGISRIIVKNF